MLKAAMFVEQMNTPESGERWLNKVKTQIRTLSKAKAKYALCNNPSLQKYKYSCFAYSNWIIAFRITDNTLEVCRFVYGPRLK